MKEALSLLLALLMLCTSVTALAHEPPEFPNVMDHTSFSQFPLVAEGENVTITVATVRNAAYGRDAEDTWFWKWSEYATGLDFEVTQFLDTSLADNKSLLFASNELPELLMALQLSTDELIQYGMIESQLKNLAPYINEDTMPYLSKWFSAYPEAKALCTAPDGAMYTLPFFTNLGVPISTQEVININETLVQEAGMEIPATLDAFTALMYKIKELHPDYIPIAGVAGAASMTSASSGGDTLNPLSYLLNAFGYITSGSNDYGYEVALRNGEVVIPCGDEAFLAYLKLCKQYYEDGIIQPDFFTADSISVTALMTEHRTALYPAPAYMALPTADEFQQWVSVKPLTSAWNETPAWKDSDPITVGGVAVAAHTSDDHVDKILRYLDFFYSELGDIYLWEGPLYGSADTLGMVRGMSYLDGAKYFYDVKDGTYESNLHYVYAVGFGSSTAFGNRSHSIDHPQINYITTIIQYCLGVPIDEIEPFVWVHTHGDGHNRLTMAEHVAPYFVEGFPGTVYYSEEQQETINEVTLLLNDHVEKEVAKFITGARDLSEFDAFVAECEAYGLRELEEIYRSGYENYKKNF